MIIPCAPVTLLTGLKICAQYIVGPGVLTTSAIASALSSIRPFASCQETLWLEHHPRRTVRRSCQFNSVMAKEKKQARTQKKADNDFDYP